VVTTDLDAEEALLFGEPTDRPAVSFEMDSAYQGVEALAKVRAAQIAGLPYAMAFIDMRMPPGWDGVETAEHLCCKTSATDRVLHRLFRLFVAPVLTRLDVRDRLLILKKPFDAIEVYQFANALTTKWQMTEQAAFKMNRLEEAVEERTRELSNANIIVQNSPVILYRLRGEPSFPLIYISHNITKLGHDPKTLLASPSWAQSLIYPDDQAKVGDAMARVLEKDAQVPQLSFDCAPVTAPCVGSRTATCRCGTRMGASSKLKESSSTLPSARRQRENYAARPHGRSHCLANRSTFTERLRQALPLPNAELSDLRFFISIWTNSNPSMTRLATRSVICCCNRSRSV